MHLLCENKGTRVYSHTVEGQAVPALPFSGTYFPCLVWQHGEPWKRDAMLNFARALIRTGCRNAVCVGPRHNGLDWETAFDMAWVDEYLNAPDEVREAYFLMTSQHNDETADDVAFWFIQVTCFDYHYFQDFLLLHVGTGPEMVVEEDAITRQLGGCNE